MSMYLAMPFRIGIARRPQSCPSASFLVVAVAAHIQLQYVCTSRAHQHTASGGNGRATIHSQTQPSRSRKSCSRQSDNEFCPFLFAATASSAAPAPPHRCRDPASPTSKKEKAPRLKNKSRSVDSGQSSLSAGPAKARELDGPFSLFGGLVRSTQGSLLVRGKYKTKN
ncbi:hypothetical protein GGI42DRAFT_70221 [Trichoderma sp. SZMC 28013]